MIISDTVSTVPTEDTVPSTSPCKLTMFNDSSRDAFESESIPDECITLHPTVLHAHVLAVKKQWRRKSLATRVTVDPGKMRELHEAHACRVCVKGDKCEGGTVVAVPGGSITDHGGPPTLNVTEGSTCEFCHLSHDAPWWRARRRKGGANARRTRQRMLGVEV